jgi:hypothetical protein
MQRGQTSYIASATPRPRKYASMHNLVMDRHRRCVNLSRNPNRLVINVQVSRGEPTGYGEHRAIDGFLGGQLKQVHR